MVRLSPGAEMVRVYPASMVSMVAATWNTRASRDRSAENTEKLRPFFADLGSWKFNVGDRFKFARFRTPYEDFNAKEGTIKVQVKCGDGSPCYNVVLDTGETLHAERETTMDTEADTGKDHDFEVGDRFEFSGFKRQGSEYVELNGKRGVITNVIRQRGENSRYGLYDVRLQDGKRISSFRATSRVSFFVRKSRLSCRNVESGGHYPVATS